MLTLDKVYHAQYVLKEAIRQTDMIYAPKIKAGAEVYLKTCARRCACRKEERYQIFDMSA